MSGPIVRTGTTPEFWKNYDSIFGDKKKSAAPKKAGAKAAAKPVAKAATAVAKPAKKAAKKTAKKKK